MKKPPPILASRIIADMRPGEEFGDPDHSGLRVRRTISARVFFYRYRSQDGALREIKLGEFGAMTLAEARKALGRLKLERERGIDPQLQKQQSRADAQRTLSALDLSKIADPYTAMSLRLQAAFGLRRAESIKIQPAWADRGDRLVLRPSWCKGGRAREIPLRTAAQGWLLRDAKALAGRGSLIPADSRFVEQLHRFTYQCSQAGIHHVHGHRHAYAQLRYRELTGWNAPAAGGPLSRALTTDQKAVDREARLIIS